MIIPLNKSHATWIDHSTVMHPIWTEQYVGRISRISTRQAAFRSVSISMKQRKCYFPYSDQQLSREELSGYLKEQVSCLFFYAHWV